MLFFEYPQRFRKPHSVGIVEKSEEHRQVCVCVFNFGSKLFQTSPNHPKARLPSTFHHFTVPWFPRSKASTFWHQVPMEEQQELQRRATALQEHLEAAEPETPVHLCVSWSSYVMVIPHENRDIHDTQCVWNPWWWEDVRGPYDINLMF